MRKYESTAAATTARTGNGEDGPLPLDYVVSMSDVTQLLNAANRGDRQAAADLLPLVYDELRKLAAAKMAREKPGQTLDATGLVHEAYLRLVGDDKFDHRGHFFAAAAEAMRRILVESARRKRRHKHGGQMTRVDFEDGVLDLNSTDERILALDEAVERFAQADPPKAALLKLRSFGGLTLEEAAAILNIAPATADRWWAYAKAWLRVELSGENLSDS